MSDNSIYCLIIIKKFLIQNGLKKAVKYIDKKLTEISNNNIEDMEDNLPNILDLLQSYNKNNNISDPILNSKNKVQKKKIKKNHDKETDIKNIQCLATLTDSLKNSNKKSKKSEKIKLNTCDNIYTEHFCTSDHDQLEFHNIYKSQVKDIETINSNIYKNKQSQENRFSRINDSWNEKITDERLKDNSYWNMKKYNKDSSDFASKAAIELGKVRGKNFRQEKAKKKRCSWRGSGNISCEVNSVQFNDSD
ncbi:SRP40 C-terminal domain-containing protein [Cryptosporidium muris RN66]|uniref:SRP40 C-terminal domain-containing protein n=1 Tax=Cryptosporidium muris (strain RN66) TaxID=441375 RepID=B6AK38_CRYMR|nr:SRP40 C-terminal domain-containing protein [Cryptosporidium muris RN66]EEA08579.1 SRP40 C-terminal domain-containing protein [Cryptosporidium muris RN66]|eukprot:XP_002142928.1 SRP40 C-terminal domain-containing protein [Cryptosporidium muris RN66]